MGKGERGRREVPPWNPVKVTVTINAKIHVDVIRKDAERTKSSRKNDTINPREVARNDRSLKYTGV